MCLNALKLAGPEKFFAFEAKKIIWLLAFAQSTDLG